MNKFPFQKVEVHPSYKIVTASKGKYFIKKRKRYDQEVVYKLLEERGFPHFLKPIETLQEMEEVFPYLDERKLNPQEKAIDMMHVLSLLQNKTTFYKEVCLDEVKDIYEKTKEKIFYLQVYYGDLEERFFKEVYPSPSVYLLQRNFSLLFESLMIASQMLEKWYEIIIEKSRYRTVLVHRKFELSHLLEVDIPRLVSLDALDYGLPIDDFLYFFNCHCLEQDMETLFAIYQQKYPYTKEEFYLFACFLLIPPKITFQDTVYQDCLFLSKVFRKMYKVRTFLLKQNEKYEHKCH